ILSLIDIEGAIGIVGIRLRVRGHRRGLDDLALKALLAGIVGLLFASESSQIEVRLTVLVRLILNPERTDRGYTKVADIQSALVISSKYDQVRARIRCVRGARESHSEQSGDESSPDKHRCPTRLDPRRTVVRVQSRCKAPIGPSMCVPGDLQFR